MKIELDLPEKVLAEIDQIVVDLEEGTRDKVITEFCTHCLVRAPHLPLLTFGDRDPSLE